MACWGSQSAVSAGTAFPLPRAAQSTQPVHCIFFQKGRCLKGDTCAFLHGPYSVASKPQVAQPTAEIKGQKSVFCIPQRSAPEPELYQPNLSNANHFTDVKVDSKVSNAQTKADAAKRVTKVTRFSNGSQQHEMPKDFMMPSVKDAADVYRESSPGFDVLVDDELAQDQYYDVDQYGGTRRDHKGKNGEADHEMYHDPRGYDVHDELASHHARFEDRRSSDRIPRGTDSLQTWNDNGCSSDRICHSDLRNRLKLKKDRGLRSGISKDFAHNNHERKSGESRRGSWAVAPIDGSLSSRLLGRITDRRRSPTMGSVLGMGRNKSRTSPCKKPNPRQDRIKSA